MGIAAHDLLKTRDCTAWSCVRPATGDDGLCDEHREQSPGPEREWTADVVLDAIRAHVARHGHPPTQVDFGENGLPSITTLKRLFGNLGNAIVEAGYERPSRGGARRSLPIVAQQPEPPAPEPEPEPRMLEDQVDDESAGQRVFDAGSTVFALMEERSRLRTELGDVDQRLRAAIDACRMALDECEVAA